MGLWRALSQKTNAVISSPSQQEAEVIVRGSPEGALDLWCALHGTFLVRIESRKDPRHETPQERRIGDILAFIAANQDQRR